MVKREFKNKKDAEKFFKRLSGSRTMSPKTTTTWVVTWRKKRRK